MAIEGELIFEKDGGSSGSSMTWHPFVWKSGGEEYAGTVCVMTSNVGGMMVNSGTELTWCENAPPNSEEIEKTVLAEFRNR